MNRLRIHSHPKQERSRRVKKGHVIVDGELFLELVNRFGSWLPTESTEDSRRRS